METKHSVVINCPTCHRTIWANSVCNHGAVPEPHKDAPKEPGERTVYDYKPKTRDRRR